MQCWDSKLVYTYFRLTADNRLLLGGGSAITTFLKDAYNNPGIIKRVIADFYEHFPQLKSLAFIQFWPGQIDTTRDLLPTIVRPKDQPHLRFIFGCVGIPWATFTGSFAARNVLGDADDDYRKYFNYFSNERYFWLPRPRCDHPQANPAISWESSPVDKLSDSGSQRSSEPAAATSGRGLQPGNTPAHFFRGGRSWHQPRGVRR
jgi:hypothetical protein